MIKDIHQAKGKQAKVQTSEHDKKKLSMITFKAATAISRRFST